MLVMVRSASCDKPMAWPLSRIQPHNGRGPLVKLCDSWELNWCHLLPP